MQTHLDTLEESKAYIEVFFQKNNKPEHVFHDLDHTVQVVAAARNLADGYHLGDNEKSILELAAWFHDAGYVEGGPGHEERSCQIATSFLSEKIPQEHLNPVLACIRATKLPQNPQNLLEKILCDADLSHLGMKTYWERNAKYRQEVATVSSVVIPLEKQLDEEIEFLSKHEYHSELAREMFNKRKAKNLQQVLKQRNRLNPDGALDVKALALMDEEEKQGTLEKSLKKQEKSLKQMKQGRGVETMYRTTYNTNNNLSRMADSKANMMLSINTIVISIVVSNLLPRLSENRHLMIPTMILLLTCLISMVYATLSTRPSITEGKVTRESIKNRTANLLFFGNFHNMPLDDYQWGINEMLNDTDFLYNTMSKDLYFLGIVLAKKYNYLSICYNVFMYGLIASVAAFAVAFMI